MLDRMIESQNNPSENFRRGNFLLTTMALVAMTLGGAMVYSLYAKSLGDLNENLEFSSVVAPIAETEPPVEAIKPDPKTVSISKAQTETIRIVNQKSIDESPDIPTGLSTVKNQYESRPQGAFKLGNMETTAATSSGSGDGREIGTNGKGIPATPKIIDDNENNAEPPQMPKTEPKPEIKPIKPVVKSLGVVNGMAKTLPVPVYPAPAKAVGVRGAVNVQITIDESGKVVSAKAISGHPLLRQSAEQAAQRAVFLPTKLSNVPVKATGIIVYNFIGQ